MKKLFLLALLALSFGAQAQFNYTFSYYTQPYATLTGATQVNNGPWDDEWYKAPIGFNFDMDGRMIDSLSILEMFIFATDSADTINAFIPLAADLIDRNLDTGTVVSYSPVRYVVSGTTPNRIFKVEVAGAGFYDELFGYGTTNDSVYFQVWLYETSNIVEMRYGPSSVTHYSDYFYNDSAVVNTGYLKDTDWDGTYIKMFYFLEGLNTAPTIDSTVDIMDPLNEGLDSIPPSGMVYRFEPTPASVKDMTQPLSSVKVYPTVCHADLFIEHAEQELNYKVVSMSGAVVRSGKINDSKSRMDISQLPAGAYTIHLRSEKGEKAVQFLKI